MTETHSLWATCRSDLDPDGALRDIYVERTSLPDWDAMLRLLFSLGVRLEFTHEGEPTDLPRDANEIFGMAGTASTLLTAWLGGLAVNCHFFSVDEIEMDVDPREIRTESDFGSLLGFVRSLGDTLGRDVLFTQENWKEEPILRYVASRRAFERPPFQTGAG